LISSQPDLRFFRVERAGAVAVCLLDRPPANALDEALHADFSSLLGWLEADDSVRAVVLGSAHETIFMAGARLEEFPDEHFGSEATAKRVDLAQATFMRVQRLPKGVTAAITGHALGGGCELALACDFRFMTEGKPLIGCPEIRLGMIPGGGGTQRLPRLVGRSRAARLLLLGERLHAGEAAEIGLVDEACPDTSATLAAARHLAGKLAELPAPGVRLIKQCLNDGFDPGLVRGLAVERAAAIEALAQPEAREGLRAFLERREPRFHP
jgi:enoyl-CoA hydratase/carnithine racemase